MTTLYRTPNLIIDAHEWHAVVRHKHGRTLLQYRWRPLSARPYAWSCMTTWQGPKPKHLARQFQVFRCHIRRAMVSESERREAVQALRGPSGALLLNSEARRGTVRGKYGKRQTAEQRVAA